jgi:hypothetical protein
MVLVPVAIVSSLLTVQLMRWKATGWADPSVTPTATPEDVPVPTITPEPTPTTRPEATPSPAIVPDEASKAREASAWYERGLRAAGLAEQLRCFNEAILLNPDYTRAYINRGRRP